MAAWLYRFGPHVRSKTPDPVNTGGQYLVVAGGVLSLAGKSYDKWSTLFVMGDEPAPTITAAAEGLDLLVLQFPPQ